MTPLVEASFWAALAARDSAPALVDSGGDVVTYADLAGRVDRLVGRLGTTRRLVLLEAANDVDTVVGYLACLIGRHPVLLAERDSPAAETLRAAYDPDVVLATELCERRVGTAHQLHPDLAQLMSTSGSTGSPKLVRLSAANVGSNAAAIASYLRIRPTDVAATTLPLHYCYGLSVVTSHLAAGAAVALTSASVTDPDFWTLVRERQVTTFPGVPHTFDLLERVGFAELDLPTLRYLTCAGGRLAPEVVRRFAALGQSKGFDLFVMYGATEATARMAYLPPDLALERPESVGVAIPGGSFTLRGSADVGELVYRGDNVMLGYAETPADLARGRDVDELRTGDLARIAPDGLVEIVGRSSRFAKVFGLRVDLDRVEQVLRRGGVVGHAADGGQGVVVGIDRTAAPINERVVLDLLTPLGIPASALNIVPLDDVPRLASGKPDFHAISALATRSDGSLRWSSGQATHPERRVNAPGVTVRRVFEEVLRRKDVSGDDSFVSLGGDSLSYVAASLRLEPLLGHLPTGWHQMTVAELEAVQATRSDGSTHPEGRVNAPGVTGRRVGAVETNVLLRAAAIVMIVGSHANLFMLLGGAHVLVGLAGFNFGRFQVTDRPRRERLRSMTRSIMRVVVPSVLWLSFAAAASAKYDLLNVTLLNGVFGTREWSEAWHYWFIEALVWTLVVLSVLLAIPWVDRLERRWEFWLPFGLAVLALLPRYDVVRLFGGDHIHRAHVIFWLFALGWATAKAPTHWHRLLVSVVVAATVPGFFDGGQPLREAVVVAGMLLLVWVPHLRVPVLVGRFAGVLAGASLFIYLVHWQVYPAYEFEMPWLATSLSLAAGIAFWWTFDRAAASAQRVMSMITNRVAVRAGWEIRDDLRWLRGRRYPTRDRHTAPAGAALPVGSTH